MSTQQHFADRAERSIRRLQRAGLADKKVNPTIAADALGSMVGRFAELWMVQGYRDYDFDEAVEQLTHLWANALGIDEVPTAGVVAGSPPGSGMLNFDVALDRWPSLRRDEISVFPCYPPARPGVNLYRAFGSAGGFGRSTEPGPVNRGVERRLRS